MKVYANKEASTYSSVNEKIVLHLVDGHLDQEPDLYTDNYYAGIPLAEKLIYSRRTTFSTKKKFSADERIFTRRRPTKALCCQPKLADAVVNGLTVLNIGFQNFYYKGNNLNMSVLWLYVQNNAVYSSPRFFFLNFRLIQCSSTSRDDDNKIKHRSSDDVSSSASLAGKRELQS